MSDATDLAPWLRAQLDEDRRLAGAASAGPWRYNPDKHHHLIGTPEFEEAVFAGAAGAGATCIAATGRTDDPQSMADAEHIAAHDPARVLRAVEARRRIITDCEDAERTLRLAGPGTPPHDIMTGATNTLRRMLRLLAIEYADRAGYREEWRPDTPPRAGS